MSFIFHKNGSTVSMIVNRPNNQPINQSISQPTNQSTPNQPTNQYSNVYSLHRNGSIVSVIEFQSPSASVMSAEEQEALMWEAKNDLVKNGTTLSLNGEEVSLDEPIQAIFDESVANVSGMSWRERDGEKYRLI